MDLVSLLVVLVVGAICYWVLIQLPLPGIVKTVATVILALILCLWLLSWAGLTDFQLQRPR